MSAMNYEDLENHIDHKLIIVKYEGKDKYGKGIAIECEDCNEVLIDYSRVKFKD